jgi:hypothetical protein
MLVRSLGEVVSLVPMSREPRAVGAATLVEVAMREVTMVDVVASADDEIATDEAAGA